MNKEVIAKKLKETEDKIKQIETIFHQLLGRKITLEEFLKEQNEENKKETPKEEKK